MGWPKAIKAAEIKKNAKSLMMGLHFSTVTKMADF